MSTFKVKDKTTGQVFTVREKTGGGLDQQRQQIVSEGQQAKSNIMAQDPTYARMQNVESKIKERGQFPETAIEGFKSPNLLRKGLAVAETVSAPFQAMDSAVANPMLAFQKGENNVGKLLGEVGAGALLRKQGEAGDVFRVAGAPEPVSATLGLALGVGAPFKAIRNVTKGLGKISKMSDKGILRAGDDLVKATDEARSHSGKALGDAFGKVDSVPVDSGEAIDAVGSLPEKLVKHLEEEIGDLGGFMQQMTVGKLRQIKQLVGQFRPQAFGKEDRGLSELLDDKAINKGYAKLKGVLESSVKQFSGDKIAKHLLDLEESFGDVMGASGFIKKTVMSPELGMATRAGKAASGLAKEGDVTTRTAMNILRGSGPEARKAINKAVDALNRFNRNQAILRGLGHVGSAITFGGALGALGGAAISRTLKGGSD